MPSEVMYPVSLVADAARRCIRWLVLSTVGRTMKLILTSEAKGVADDTAVPLSMFVVVDLMRERRPESL